MQAESPLEGMNTTELVQLAREAGLGNLPRDRDVLIRALIEDVADETCPLEEKRVALQRHIARDYARLRTQLPGCNGKCVSFGCPDLIVQRCWGGAQRDML